jgi:quercetin dioxygenase-like cupin family protein
MQKENSQGDTMSDSSSAPRLREHPVSRFEGNQHVFDLNQIHEQLCAEPHGAIEGHRQIALYHYGSVTQVLFAFDAGGKLDEHEANGVVSIHVLDGALTVEAEGQSNNLSAGQVLVLAPNVRHAVRADDAARMLLSVHLHGAKHDDAPHRDSERDTTERTP